jgi:hypothetical protein
VFNLRVLGRLRAYVALAAFVGSFALPLVAKPDFGPDDDSACGQVSLVNGHPVTQIEMVVPPKGFDHCPFCHLQRALSGAAPSTAVALVLPLGATAVASPVTRHAGTTAVPHRPSRGPPSITLS